MVLSQEQISQLKKYCGKNIALNVIGFNDLGQRFETTARITVDDLMEPAVYETGIFFEFGNTPKSHSPQRTDIFAPYLLDYSPKEYPAGNALIIDKITLPSGEVILQNPDSEKYYEQALQQKQKFDERINKNGMNITEYDPVTAKVSNMIGQPVIIDGRREGVLLNVSGVTIYGDAILNFIRDGGAKTCAFVKKDSRATTVDLDGNIKFIEVNGKTEEECKRIDKIYQDRLDRQAEFANLPSGPQ